MSETPQERREAAATRRRWVTLAEVVAVAGVVIAALTLWSNWSDRRADQAEKAANQTAEARAAARIALTATIEDDGKTLALKDERHDITDATIAFPAALGVDTQSPAGDPAIEAAWFAAPVLKLTDGGADDRTGRLPVLITVRYWDGDEALTATDTYDVIWRTRAGGLMSGRKLSLEGIRLRHRGGTQQTIDAAWQRMKP